MDLPRLRMTRRRLCSLALLLPALLWAGAALAQDGPAGLGQLLGDLSTAVSGQAGESGQLSGRLIQIFAVITVLSLAPGLAICMTSFTR